MSSHASIYVENLTKTYKLYNSPADRLKESLHPLRKQYHHDFYALNNISFEIMKGESVGIIGKNGSGKSTLLKILTGVLTPTSGSVTVNGKVSALLELGSGFNPELTGIENVYFNGMLMGYTREEMDERLDDILSFADIGEFINQPVKTYSSGMFVRLAFAVGVNIEPDILIIDEALSVGDSAFQKKCMTRMHAIRNSGATILFVSHDSLSIKTLCTRALLLEKGNLLSSGSPIRVVDLYESTQLKESHTGEQSIEVRETDSRSGIAICSGEIQLISVCVKDETGEIVAEVESESKISIEFVLKANSVIAEPHFGISIRNRYGISIFETNTLCMGIETTQLDADQTAIIRFELPINLAQGDYFISIGAANKAFGVDDFQEYLLWLYDAYKIKVIHKPSSIIYSGIFNMNPDFFIEY